MAVDNGGLRADLSRKLKNARLDAGDYLEQALIEQGFGRFGRAAQLARKATEALDRAATLEDIAKDLK